MQPKVEQHDFAVFRGSASRPLKATLLGTTSGFENSRFA